MRLHAFKLPPSILDLCKETYGGLFTTVQVEDVKSFLYILSIVLGTLGYGFLDSNNKISDQYLIFIQIYGPNRFIENLLLIYPLSVGYLFIVFAVPFFSHCIHSMLKHIWIGPSGTASRLNHDKCY